MPLVSPRLFECSRDCIRSHTSPLAADLNVHLLNETGQHMIWSKSGSQGPQWLGASLPLPPGMSKFQIWIEGVRGDGIGGDIAVDDVSFSGCEVSALCAQDAFTCGGLECIHASQQCDFISQCSDGEDEAYCGRERVTESLMK